MLSLQSLCLDVIVTNFKDFHLAFTVSKDAKLQRGMEFLQRKFSDYLAEKILWDRDIYYDFILNKHLNSVDFFWFKSVRHLKSIDDFFRRLPNLRRIKFDISGDEILKSVAKFCPKIVEIDAEYSRISDKGIKCLCETKNGLLPCPELKRILRIRGSLFTDKGAEWLMRSVPSIEKLDYRNLPIVLHSIHSRSVFQNQKSSFCNLTYLSFQDCRKVPYFTDVIKTCLTACPKLEELVLRPSDKVQLDALTNSGLRLKKLILRFLQGRSKFNIDSYLKANGHTLTVLFIANCSVSASVLAVHCPALEHLEATDVDFTYDINDQNTIFPSLTKFDFGAKKPDIVKTASLLPSLSPKVEHLKISCPTLSTEMKNQILLFCQNPAARSIAFLDCRLEIVFLRDCLLNSISLFRGLAFFRCTFDVDNPKELLDSVTESLPHKPSVIGAR